MGLSIGLVPSLAIGIGAYGAGELIFNSKKKEQKANNLYDILSDAKNKNVQIQKMATKIEDIELVKYIEQIHDSISKIIETVEKKPEKYKKMDNFFSYYLPVTIQILNRYDEIENQRLTNAETKKFMQSTKNMMSKINEAFKEQLAKLYQSDIIDTDAEMKVFETMLKSDGFTLQDDFNINKRD